MPRVAQQLGKPETSGKAGKPPKTKAKATGDDIVTKPKKEKRPVEDIESKTIDIADPVDTPPEVVKKVKTQHKEEETIRAADVGPADVDSEDNADEDEEIVPKKSKADKPKRADKTDKPKKKKKKKMSPEGIIKKLPATSRAAHVTVMMAKKLSTSMRSVYEEMSSNVVPVVDAKDLEKTGHNKTARHKQSSKARRTLRLLGPHAYKIGLSGAYNNMKYTVAREVEAFGGTKVDPGKIPFQPSLSDGAKTLLQLFLVDYAKTATYYASLYKLGQDCNKVKIHKKHMIAGFSKCNSMFGIPQTGASAYIFGNDGTPKAAKAAKAATEPTAEVAA